MKLKLLSLLLLLLSINCISQTLDNLKKETKKVYDANYLMEFEAVVAQSYPKIIETIGQDKMLELLDLDYQNDDFRYRLQLVNPIFIYSDIKKIEDKSYCVISYKNPVRIFYEKKLSMNDGIKKATQIKEETQATQVTFEPKRNSFNVRRNSKFIAIADTSTKMEWKFFNLDDVNQKKVFDSLCSESVKKELGL